MSFSSLECYRSIHSETIQISGCIICIGLESLRLATWPNKTHRIVHIMRGGIVLLAKATLLLGCIRLTAADDASCEDASLLQVPQKIGEFRRPLNLAVIDPGQHW